MPASTPDRVIVCVHGTRIELPCRPCTMLRRIRERLAAPLDDEHARSIAEQRAAEARDERVQWDKEDGKW